MPGIMTISFHDDTHEEITFSPENGLYWKITPHGLMIRTDGVRGSRTVYPWASIRKYHIETEVGLRDREERARERFAEQLAQKFKLDPEAVRHFQGSGPVGGRGDVHVEADPSSGRPEGDAAERTE